MFNCLHAEDIIAKRKKEKFLLRFVESGNLICSVFRNMANEDLATLRIDNTQSYVSGLSADLVACFEFDGTAHALTMCDFTLRIFDI